MQFDLIYFRCRIHNQKYIDVEILDVSKNMKYYGNSRDLLLSSTYIDENTIKYFINTDFNYTNEIKISRDILKKYLLLADIQKSNNKFIYFDDLISVLSIEELFI